MVRIAAVTLLALLFTVSRARADVESGPTVGEKIPALKVLHVVGDNEGNEVDTTAERGEKPTLYVFVRTDRWTRPVARTIKVLDEKANKESEDVRLVAVWLTDDKEKTKDYLPRAQQALKLERAILALHADLNTGPENWGINSDADLTVVLTANKKVAARFGFVSPNEKVVEDVLALQSFVCRSAGIAIKLECESALPAIRLDPGKMKQVILNLCKNAVEAMPQGGCLTVKLYRCAESIVLEITDSGVGLPDCVNVFELFTTTKPGGKGIGLFIVQQIVTAHDGTITHWSEPGFGTGFKVVFPIAN